MLPYRPDLPPLPDPTPEARHSRGLSLRGVFVFIGFVAVGGAIGFVLGRLESLAFLETLPPLGLFTTLFVGVPLVLAVHEAGHVAGGAVARFQFALFIVGPLRLERERDQIAAKLNRSIGLAGGVALSVPRDAQNLRGRLMWFVGGGPLASLALGGLGVGIGVAMGGAFGGALTLVGVVSFVIALVTLMPGRTGGFATDGARLLTLFRGGPRAEREAAVFALIASSMSGVRLRDWDPDLVAQAAALQDGGALEESALAFQTLYTFDAGLASEAHAALSRRIEIRHAVPASAQAGLPADATVFEGIIRGDAERARVWHNAIPSRAALADPAAVALAEWASARASGDQEATDAAAQTVRHAATVGDGISTARLAWIDAAGHHAD